MELREYWPILRRWLWLVVLSTVLAASAAYFVSKNTQPVYQSTVTLRLDLASGDLTNEYAAVLTANQLAGTYSEQIRMRPVLGAVLEALDLQDKMSPSTLAGRVTVASVRDTQLIRVSVQDTDPQMAAIMANQIVEVFIAQNQEFEQNRYADSKLSLSKQMTLMQEELETTQAALDVLGPPTTAEEKTELDRLDLTLASQQAAYANLLSNYEGIRIAEASESSNVVVAEEAIPVYSPIRPRTMANTLLAAVVGAMLAVGIILLVEYLDDTVKTPEDLASVTDLSTLGAIADIEGRTDRDRLVTLLTPRSAISEAYRMLRTNIQFAAVDGQVKSIMVTSSGSGEGKSTTAANLAIVMAQTGRRVILIDADLRRPIQHRLFELPNSKGLTMALLDINAPPKEHLQVTPVPGLQVMTSGAIPPNPAELLGSQRQADLLADLEKEADLIILDSPPVLTVADALVLAPRVGGVLLVVEVGSTRRGAIQKAVDALLHADARLLGVALNRLTLRRSAYYYHYYQQYYRQYEEGEKDSSRRRSFLPGFKR
jgi:non-specific protein-tyrosine kinase